MASTQTNGSKANAGGAEIQEQIDRLREDIAELSKTIIRTGESKAANAERSVSQATSDAVDMAKTEVANLDADLKARIRDNPLQAIGIAAGVGFVAAMLSRH